MGKFTDAISRVSKAKRERKKEDVQVSVMTKILKICIKVLETVEETGNLSCLGTKKINQRLRLSREDPFKKKCWVSVATASSVCREVLLSSHCFLSGYVTALKSRSLSVLQLWKPAAH